MSRLRIAWKTLLARFVLVAEFCHRCGNDVAQVWTAPAELWAEVARRVDGGGVPCIRCFDRIAWAQGRFLRWVPHEESVDGPGLQRDPRPDQLLETVEWDALELHRRQLR